MSKLDYFCKFKLTFCYEDYIANISSDSLRQWFTCLRLASHKLEIEFGRFNGIDRNNRFCKLCNQNAIESEYYFILCCEKYRDIRLKYLGYIAWPSMNKFISIMSCKNKKYLINVCKYIKEAISLRSNTLSITTAS